MTPEKFAKEMAAELSARNADIPFDTLLHLVQKTEPPDGSKINPKQMVDLFFQLQLVSSLTAAEWETATDPAPMLIRVRFQKLAKEFTQFGCACCRRVWDLLPPEYQHFLETIEQFLRDNFTREDPETLFIVDSPRRLEWEELFQVDDSLLEGMEEPVQNAAGAVYDLFEPGYHAAVAASLGAAEARASGVEGPAYVAERAAQADLLRAMLGNPLHRAE
jgi:hypothetical protein